MADKPVQLILEALGRAAAEPAGVPLHGGKAAAGLFATTAPAKQAAQRCKDEGYLRVVRTESRGKTVQEVCALTEKGLAYLLSQVSPRQVLEDFVRALESRQAQVDELLAVARQTQDTLDGLKATAEKVLRQLGKPSSPAGAVPSGNGSETWRAVALSYLAQWQASGSSEDCPLPTLFARARQAEPGLGIGHFHDGLRGLYEDEKIYLHPWTGPLYEIPEPQFALLIGHDIAYYASIREGTRPGEKSP